jgi:hypothetical protein
MILGLSCFLPNVTITTTILKQHQVLAQQQPFASSQSSSSVRKELSLSSLTMLLSQVKRYSPNVSIVVGIILQMVLKYMVMEIYPKQTIQK